MSGGYGCDLESTSAIEYEAVVHVDVATFQDTTWAKKAMQTGTFEFSTDPKSKDALRLDSKACGSLLKDLDAVTLGAGHDRLELYLEGTLGGQATTCFDELEARVAAKKTASKGTSSAPDTVRIDRLSKAVVGIVIGPAPLPTPSIQRLDDLLDAHPGTTGHEPLWFTVRGDATEEGFESLEGWADPSQGLDARMVLELKNAEKANLLQSQASLAITALQLSGDAPDLGQIVRLSASGNTLTADVHATEAQIVKLMQSAEDDENAREDDRPNLTFEM